MLSIFLTEELERYTRDMKDSELLFYFCSHQDEKRNNAVAVLRGLAYQLVRKRPSLINHILTDFESLGKTDETLKSPNALWIVMERLLQDPDLGTVFCVLDGLDECDDASSRLLVDKFCAYFSPKSSTSNGGRLKLAIVSRKIARLDVFPQVKLDPDNEEHVNENIKLFISARVNELERVQGFNNIRETVKAKLLSRADGTFLWVGFVMNELLKKETCIDIKEALDSFPPGLGAIYNRILLRTETRRQPVISQILRWVTLAVRPLKLQELTAAICIPPTANISDDQAMRDHITLCEPILEIHGQQVSLVHQSARDYLLREKVDNDPIPEVFRFKIEEAHSELARVCLDYIEKSNLSLKYLNINDASVLQNSPLLNYATLHWAEHARQSGTHLNKDYDLKRPFLEKKSVVRTNWWIAYRKTTTLWGNSDSIPLLHMACHLGIEPLARKVLERWIWKFKICKIVDKKDREGHTALKWATAEGHRAIVKLLLEKGADVKNEPGSRVLWMAAEEGDEAMVKLLLRKGANIKDGHINAALFSAAAGGHETVVRLLLENGVDFNAEANRGAMALYVAVINGHETIVELLLKRGADVNASHGFETTALYGAVEKGHETIVELLLRKGADANPKLFHGTAVLQLAVEKGHEPIVRLLLDKGANVNANAGNGTALYRAVVGGHEAIVKLLLNKGADVNQKVFHSTTVLRKAVEKGHESIVKLLLDMGADVNADNDTGMSALHVAIMGGHETIAKLLLEKGADINAVTKDGMTVLKVATENWHTAVVKLLLENGVA